MGHWMSRPVGRFRPLGPFRPFGPFCPLRAAYHLSNIRMGCSVRGWRLGIRCCWRIGLPPSLKAKRRRPDSNRGWRICNPLP